MVRCYFRLPFFFSEIWGKTVFFLVFTGRTCQGKSNICRFFPFLWTFLFRITALLLTPPPLPAKMEIFKSHTKTMSQVLKTLWVSAKWSCQLFREGFHWPLKLLQGPALGHLEAQGQASLRGSRERYASNHHGGGGGLKWQMGELNNVGRIRTRGGAAHIWLFPSPSSGTGVPRGPQRRGQWKNQSQTGQPEAKHSWSWW